jgi:hypothetical protein
MQTFITNSTKTFGVEDLDSKRLNKQLLECRQILTILAEKHYDPDTKIAWRNHPAVKMWAGSEGFLLMYILAVRDELAARGVKYEKNMFAIMDVADNRIPELINDTVDPPAWWTDPIAQDRVITTHRASLYKKDPVAYAQYGML